MRGRTARRREAQRWVRRNRPPVSTKLPALVERYVYEPMTRAEGDDSGCPYYRGVGTCWGGCREEPRCFTDEPLYGWPRARMARGWTR